MKIIYNNFIPFEGFVAMTVFNLIFARKEYKPLSAKTINHESIHWEQVKECGFIFFYIIYGLEWFIRLFINKNPYRSISFEQEAYANEKNMDYIKTRKHYSMWRKK